MSGTHSCLRPFALTQEREESLPHSAVEHPPLRAGAPVTSGEPRPQTGNQLLRRIAIRGNELPELLLLQRTELGNQNLVPILLPAGHGVLLAPLDMKELFLCVAQMYCLQDSAATC